MRIVCDSCGAKYSVSDEKVAGRVFKIRCKKCSATIIVRGDQVEVPKAKDTGVDNTQSYDENPEAVWHVVVDEEQQGPFTNEQLDDMLNRGAIDMDSYVWREGFEGWLVLRDVPELAEALGDDGEGATVAVSAVNLGLGGGMGTDPFADPSSTGSTPGRDVFSSGGVSAEEDAQATVAMSGNDALSQLGIEAPQAHTGRSDDTEGESISGLFSDAGGGVLASVPSPEPKAPQTDQSAQMTGQRNENSVLFSLQNLKSIAATEGGSPPLAQTAPGNASGDASGLIDIRALASATASVNESKSKESRADDLLGIGGGANLGAPILAPVEEEKSSNKVVLIAAIVMGSLVVVGGTAFGLAWALKGPNDGTTAANAATPQTPEQPAIDPGSDEKPKEPQGKPDDQAQASAQDVEQGVDERKKSPSKTRKRRKRSGRSKTVASAAPAAPAAPTPKPAKRGGGGGDDFDDLLSQLGPKKGGGGGSQAAPSNLPDTPSKDSVGKALRSVQGRVKACGKGESGIAMVQVTVAGSTGRVTNATVTGQFAGTPVGSCVARAVRKVRFSKFKRSTFQVGFPYRL